ncbi:MAG: hypothetical protein AAF723_09615 [Pseudomonadota bacterium]
MDQALTEAEAHKNLQVSYTMTFEWPGEPIVKQRYNAQTENWSLLEGAPDTLPPSAQTKLRNVQKSESKIGGLLYADYRPYLTDVALINETDTQYIYQFIPPEANKRDLPEDIHQRVHARLTVQKSPPTLLRYEVKALEPLSPYPLVEMEEFVVDQTFTRQGENGLPLLTKLTSKQKGKRPFKKIDTEFTATFSDFEVLTSTP